MFIPLVVSQVLSDLLMLGLGIGLNINSLPAALVGVGIGVDYGIYILSRLSEEYPFSYGDYRKARYMAIIFTALTLVISVIFFVFADFIFQSGLSFASSAKQGFKDSMYSLCFVNEKEGWAVGARGNIRHTLDGGLNWEDQDAGTRMMLLSFSFCNPKVGWIVGKGSTILHTTDGGKTWNKQTAPERKRLFTAKALSPDKCVTTGDWGAIFYTEDGGITWETITIAPDDKGELPTFYEVIMQGDFCIAAGDRGAIMTSQDGGKTWQQTETSIDIKLSWFSGLEFLGEKKAIIVGARSMTIITEND
ncbi:MAG: YCF48-related protein [Pseudomonadota bacterium]